MGRSVQRVTTLGLFATVGLIVSFCGALYASSRVVEENGNILAVRSDGSRIRITSSGIDSQPDLAPDGTKAVFVRKAEAGGSEIWIAAAMAGASAEPLVKPPLKISGRTFGQVFSPKFSPDGTFVYFLIPFAATTQAILKVSVAKPEPQFVAAALNLQVVPDGEYRGDLVAQIRKAKLAPGYYEWYWLLTPDGKEVGLVGQDERDVALFLEQQE